VGDSASAQEVPSRVNRDDTGSWKFAVIRDIRGEVLVVCRIPVFFMPFMSFMVNALRI
jgi:hypothetical protein